MNLVETIGLLQVRAAATDDESKIKSRTGEFATLNERLSEVSEIGRRVVDALDSLGPVEVGKLNNTNGPSAKTLVSSLITQTETLRINEKMDRCKGLVTQLETYMKSLEKTSADKWKSLLPELIPAIDDDLLDALARADIDVEKVRSDVETARITMLALRNKRLPTSGDVHKLEVSLDILASVSERIAQLVDPTLARIIVHSQREGVPLQSVTDDNRSELNRLGIAHRFRVVFK